MSTLIPIYMYHQVVAPNKLGDDRYLFMGSDVFLRQVRELKKSGWSFITLGEAWRRIESGEKGPKAVVLTFDDVSMNFLQNVLPLLEKEEAVATIFPIVGRMNPDKLTKRDLDIGFPMQGKPLRRCVDAGMEVGSHTLTHRELTTLPEAEVRRELVDSRKDLEDLLGSSVTTLCYPRGRVSPRIEAAAGEAGYACACATLRGNCHTTTDRFRLKRIRAHQERLGFSLTYTTLSVYDWCNWNRTRRERARFAAQDEHKREAS